MNNIAGATWGDHNARYERFGKAAARLDDLANLLPARLSALALAAGAGPRGRTRRPHGASRAETTGGPRARTPGGSWPRWRGRSASGSKSVARYRLGEGPLPDSPRGIRRAVRVFAAATVVVVGMTVG
jgi:adenosylcobinamide-phosphate synthase